ncbi:hypothetical protein [Streptomyces carpaticus]|uniref:DUF1772 domain-containing protein n=1 Tax=Streptomyces carpaticus TaxID=285558 RepID=A0ABV4ZNP2_9ACTN
MPILLGLSLIVCGLWVAFDIKGAAGRLAQSHSGANPWSEDEHDQEMWRVEVHNVRRLGAFSSFVGLVFLAAFVFLI